MASLQHRPHDLEPRRISPALLIGGLVAWLFVGSTVFSLLAM
jgi:hypothetical protein